MYIETPESNFAGNIVADRLRAQISIRIDFLTEELENLKKKMQQEMRHSKLRQMEEQKQQMEYDLRWARYQQEHLKNQMISF